MRKSKYLSLLVCVASSIAHAQATPEPTAHRDLGRIVSQPDGLTAQRVEARALDTSALLSEKRAELDAANARVDATRRQFFPQLTVRGSYSRLSPVETSLGAGATVGALNPGFVGIGSCPMDPGSNCAVDSQGVPLRAAASTIRMPVNNYAVSAGLTIPLTDSLFRLADASAVASKNRESAKYALQAEGLKVKADARVLYFNWLRTHGQVSIAAQALQQTRARLQEAQAAFDLGKLSRADLLKIEALVSSAGLALQQAETGRRLAGRQLAIVMADSSNQEYVVGEDVPTIDAADADLASDDRVVQAALARRLELKAIDAAAQSLSHAQAATKTARAPRVDAVGQTDYANPNSRYFPPTEQWRLTWSVGLVASWNLTDAYVMGAQVDELSAKRAAVRAQREAAAQGIASEIAMAQAAVWNARAALAAGDTSLVAAEEGYRVATETFRLGQATATFVVDAESDLLNARLSMFNARIDLTNAVIRLEHALGRDVPHS